MVNTNTARVIRPQTLSLSAACGRNGKAFGNADKKAAELKAELLALLKPIRSQVKAFNEARDAWKAGYIAARSCDDAAARKAWSRYSDASTATVRNKTDKRASDKNKTDKKASGKNKANAPKVEAPKGGIIPPASALVSNKPEIAQYKEDAKATVAALALNVNRLAAAKNKPDGYALAMSEKDLSVFRQMLADLGALIEAL